MKADAFLIFDKQVRIEFYFDMPESPIGPMTEPSDLNLSPEYLQRLKNRTVCEQLKVLGDDLTLPRVIDHVATFEARKDRDLFVDLILREAFEIVSLPEPDDVRTRYEVVFSRTDAPAKIDEAILPLVTQAEALGGIYDGWNCEVIAS